MADITLWDPFADLSDFRRQIDRWFEDPRRAFSVRTDGQAYFPVDLYETADDVVVKASLPGVRPEDVDVSVTGQVLTLKGESKAEAEDSSQSYYRRERRYGTFVRQLTLPTEVDANKAQADFEHGVLRLTLPKAEAMRPKQIKINTAGVIEGGTRGNGHAGASGATEPSKTAS